ncbi:MAG TPA: hypothetical protein VFQ65_10000 [Kofleriaceae bacterium]|nr:hypothetical protein [Kofleriaceae bacterium]
MTGAGFRRWERIRTSRERGEITRWVIAVLFGGLLAALVAWRANDSVASASHAWLAGAVAAFMVAFMRVPFHVYWRPDAALLAQLPIDGTILFASALRRCIVAATTTLVTVVVGALPFAALSAKAVAAATRTLDAIPFAGDPVPRETPLELFARHAGYGVAFALVAAAFIPAVTMWAASLVAGSRNLLQIATALGGAPARAHAKPVTNPASSSAGAVLGALPGLAASVAIVVLLLASPWLLNKEAPLEVFPAAVLVAGISVFSIIGAGARIGPRMGDILRDVSALDRQRLATLEIHPPTAIERAVMKLLGAAALPYSKDARLMRRRYPMAYALGAIAFLVLAIIGLAQPADPVPWLVVPLAGALLYAGLLRARLSDAPIELVRLSATLPITPAARRLAKRAWTLAWVAVFVIVPAAFAVVRAL